MSAAPSLNYWQSFDSNLSLSCAEANDFAQTVPGVSKPLFHLRPLKLGHVARVETGTRDDTAVLNKSSWQIADDLPQAVVLPKPSAWSHDQFVPIQKWEGVVLRKGKDSFFARLVDLTSRNIDEEAEFPLEEVPPSDAALLEEGAVFYWDIGYWDQTNGQRLRASSLRFRRLPAWTQNELSEAQLRAARLQKFFGGE